METQLTLEQAGELLRLHGFKISNNTLGYYTRPSIDRGPPTSGHRGRSKLFSPARTLAWAKQHLKGGRT